VKGIAMIYEGSQDRTYISPASLLTIGRTSEFSSVQCVYKRSRICVPRELGLRD
jgi:hypothetical protein